MAIEDEMKDVQQLVVNQLGVANGLTDNNLADGQVTPAKLDLRVGNVGIGTLTPSSKLTIEDSGHDLLTLNTTGADASRILSNRGLQLHADHENNSGTSQGNIDLCTNGSVKMRVKDDGKVGIGTTSPNYALDVEITGADTIPLGIKSGTTESYVSLEDTNTTAGHVRVGSAGNSLALRAGNATRIFAKDDGNVGIGTTSPSKLLSVVSPNTATAETVAGFGNQNIERGLEIKTNGGDSSLEWGFNAVNSRHMVFDTNQTERLRIASNGNVGIGTDTPSTKLEIKAGDNNATTYILKCINSAGSGFTELGAYGLNTYATDLILKAGDNEGLRVDKDSGRVGIGIDNPNKTLHVAGSGGNDPSIKLENTTAGSSSDTIIRSQVAGGSDPNNVGRNFIYFGDAEDDNVGYLQYSHSVDAMHFITNTTEAMRITSNGTVLVGKTSDSYSHTGVRLGNDSGTTVTRNNGTALSVRRNTTDGNILSFSKDATVVGSIGSRGGHSYINLGSVGLTGSTTGGGALLPTLGGTTFVDDVVDLGYAGARFDDIYATNTSITTSDANEKQDIEELSEAEQRVAVACKGLLRKFRWKSAVEEKGEEARIHFGIIAQDLQAAFEAEGLDAGRYAMFISTTWWETQTEVPAVEAVEAQDAVYEDIVTDAVEEVLDEEGNVVTEAQPESTEQRLISEAVEAVESKDAYTRTDNYEKEEEAPEGATVKTRLGVRYSELLAFIISAI